MIYVIRFLIGLAVVVIAAVISLGLGSFFKGITESLHGPDPSPIEKGFAGFMMIFGLGLVTMATYYLGSLIYSCYF